MLVPAIAFAATVLLAAAAAENSTETCSTDHRESTFPIRVIKCNFSDLTCFRQGQYVYGGSAERKITDPKCTGLWTQGPCDKHQWLVVDKERFFVTGYVRTTCQPLSLCPKGFVRMNFDGHCYSAKEVAANCPKKRGFAIEYNVFGEGECVCARRPPLPVRYCDTVAVGNARARALAAPHDLRLPDDPPPAAAVAEDAQQYYAQSEFTEGAPAENEQR